MRKILEQRLENAQIDLKCNINLSVENVRVLQGQIEAYQDCLNLIPAPRTEQELIKEFEKLGWKVSRNDEDYFTLRLKGNPTCAIWVDKTIKEYSMNCCLDMQEHKLLHELFEVIFDE